jgi:hypothetical protein
MDGGNILQYREDQRRELGEEVIDVNNVGPELVHHSAESKERRRIG